MIRVFWPELFHLVGDEDSRRLAESLAPRVREFSELVAELPAPDDRYRPRPGSRGAVAYHHSCHMLRELRIKQQPLDLLAAAGCDTVTWQAAERCCGFGGLFSVKQPEISVAMADDKLDDLSRVDADMLVGCDASCLLQLEGRLRSRGEDLVVRHLAEVLDAADDGESAHGA